MSQQRLHQTVYLSAVFFFLYVLFCGIHSKIKVPEMSAVDDIGAIYEMFPMKLALRPEDEHNLYRRVDWKEDENLEFCDYLKNNPRPFRQNCKRHGKTMKCREGPDKFVMFSQFHQDYYLYKNHFRHQTKSGIYVDIAANEPIGISNTYFFDRCLKWSGICVEANHRYYEPLYRERSCHIVPTCVGSEDGQSVDFGLDGGGSGILGGTYKSMKKVDRLKELNKTFSSKPLRCTTMKKIIERTNVRTIDYLSLDVEGHELEVLKGFDFASVRIKIMSIEVTGADLNEIEEFLKENGYTRHLVDYKGLQGKYVPGLLKEDAIFHHNSVKFGHPE